MKRLLLLSLLFCMMFTHAAQKSPKRTDVSFNRLFLGKWECALIAIVNGDGVTTRRYEVGRLYREISDSAFLRDFYDSRNEVFAGSLRCLSDTTLVLTPHEFVYHPHYTKNTVFNYRFSNNRSLLRLRYKLPGSPLEPNLYYEEIWQRVTVVQ